MVGISGGEAGIRGFAQQLSGIGLGRGPRGESRVELGIDRRNDQLGKQTLPHGPEVADIAKEKLIGFVARSGPYDGMVCIRQQEEGRALTQQCDQRVEQFGFGVHVPRALQKQQWNLHLEQVRSARIGGLLGRVQRKS